MSTAEIEVIKEFISYFDYYLNRSELDKANKELNNLCTYILKKENLIIDSGDADLPNHFTNKIVDILGGFKVKDKALMKMIRDDVPKEPIPQTRYEFYKQRYASD